MLYRGRELRHHQFFTTAEWPGGLYYSPTFSGSRPGGLSAACWAALVTIGEEGYLKATKSILDAAATMKRGIAEIPELRLYGESLGVFSFGSEELNIYEVLDQMSARKWALTGLQHPAGIHVSTTLRQAQPGVAERFVQGPARNRSITSAPIPAPRGAWPRSMAWPPRSPTKRSFTTCCGR